MTAKPPSRVPPEESSVIQETAKTTPEQDSDEEIKYADGHHSIEHQIDVHVRDLVESPDQLQPVLEGLRYLIDYRLVNRQYPHMDYELMRRLALALLELTGRRDGSAFLRRRMASGEADVALLLFRDLLQEVCEFAEAVGRMPVGELRRKLELHCRLYGDTLVMAAVAVDVIRLLMRQPQFSDWRYFIKQERVPDVTDFICLHLDTDASGAPKSANTTKMIRPPQSLYFDRTVERVVDMFAVSVEHGLTSEEHQRRLAYYGTNELPQAPEKRWWRMLFEQVNDFMIYLLLVAACLSPIIEPEDVVSPIVLLVVVVINVSIGFVQEQRASKALSALLHLQIPKARCRRDGKDFELLDANSLVPGDIVCLQEGDSVPADLRLIRAFRLEVVEAWLTGESAAVSKHTNVIKMRSRRVPLQRCLNCAFMGTVVARGTAVGVVVRSGTKTEMGTISEALYSEAQMGQSRLEVELKRLGVWLVAIAGGLCLLIVAVGWFHRQPFKQMLHYGLNLAVSVIPEGLVAVVTVAMALAVGRMASKHAIVRKLPAVETLGSVNVICTDKTGTLTQGQMRVEAVDHGDLVDCYTVCALCNNASVIADPDVPAFGHQPGKRVCGADTTETALQQAALTNGFDKSVLMLRYGKMVEIPFDSERKMMSVMLWPCASDAAISGCSISNTSGTGSSGTGSSGTGSSGTGSSGTGSSGTGSSGTGSSGTSGTARPSATGRNGTLMAKGAPEVILQRCSFFKENNTVLHMTDSKLQQLSDTQAKWSDRGWRVLALAMGSVASSAQELEAEFSAADETIFDRLSQLYEQRLTLVGLIALVDPPRAGISDAVADCHRAGIQVIMITGDHPATAQAIAKQVGIRSEAVLKGREVDILGEEGLRELQSSQFPCVFARVSPQNKLTIVKALQARGMITAMTGDGVNDAPAIKRADVGIAMGVAGTDLAKQAADIVLADDNFGTILVAVCEGRRVYDNVQKFVVYLLACNSAEIWCVLVALLVGLPPPLASIHILFANIIADIPPSMSLSMEPEEVDLMTRRPRDSKDRLLSIWNVVYVIVYGLLISILSLSHYTYALLGGAKVDILQLRSESFICLTVLQLMLALLSRSLCHSAFTTNPLTNPYMLVAVSLSLMAMLLGCYVPGVNGVLELEPIGEWAWVRIVGCCGVLVVFSELMKLARRSCL